MEQPEEPRDSVRINCTDWQVISKQTLREQVAYLRDSSVACLALEENLHLETSGAILRTSHKGLNTTG